MRRWVGVSVLGFVSVLVGGIAAAVLVSSAAMTSFDHQRGVDWPLAAGELAAVALFLGGLGALVVGMIGAGLTALHSTPGSR